MTLGLRIMLSLLITIATIAIEKERPIIFKKYDTVIYSIEFWILILISGIE